MTAFLWCVFAYMGAHTILDLVVMAQEGADAYSVLATLADGSMVGGATYFLAVN
jgi:hypothetical protein